MSKGSNVWGLLGGAAMLVAGSSAWAGEGHEHGRAATDSVVHTAEGRLSPEALRARGLRHDAAARASMDEARQLRRMGGGWVYKHRMIDRAESQARAHSRAALRYEAAAHLVGAETLDRDIYQRLQAEEAQERAAKRQRLLTNPWALEKRPAGDRLMDEGASGPGAEEPGSDYASKPIESFLRSIR